MPRQEINYANTVFYKIVCNNLEIKDCYIGSTTDFRRRKSSHKCRCINSSNSKNHLLVYKFINDNGGWDAWTMVMIDKISCVDGLECRNIERTYVEELHGTLNMNIPNRSQHEWSQDNKQRIYARGSVPIVCACGSKYSWCNKSTHEKCKRHLTYINSLKIE